MEQKRVKRHWTFTLQIFLLFFLHTNINRAEVWSNTRLNQSVGLWESWRGERVDAVSDVCFWCLYSSRATSATVGRSVGGGGKGLKSFTQVAWLSLTQTFTTVWNRLKEHFAFSTSERWLVASFGVIKSVRLMSGLVLSLINKFTTYSNSFVLTES